jgi:4-hydroxy-2-oxoheptanedioate aldolase
VLYPPYGTRSVGGSVHALNFDTTGPKYFEKANEELLVVLQCEHIQAVQNFENVFSVPGIDAVFVGPNDLAQSMRSKDNKPPSAEAMKEALDHVLKTCKKIGVPAGLHCYSAEEARMRIEEGWQFIAIGSELRMMLSASSAELKQLGNLKKGDLAKY